MLKPSMYDIITKNDNYYEFVVAVSQKAREIVDVAEQNHVQLEENAVQLAVEEFASGRSKV